MESENCNFNTHLPGMLMRKQDRCQLLDSLWRRAAEPVAILACCLAQACSAASALSARSSMKRRQRDASVGGAEH
jgi:hypothetical protein